MGKVVILEDDIENADLLRAQIESKGPEGLDYTILSDSQEFREYLQQGNNADLYFLDNNVPSFPGEKPKRQFVENCFRLVQDREQPNVFYTGSTSGDIESEYCRQLEIEMIKKENIIDVINRELS